MRNFTFAAFADEAGTALSDQISAMHANGISYLEIRGVDGQNIADITEEKAKEIRKRLDGEGLAVWSLGSPYGKVGINDDMRAHLESFKRGLGLAEILGAKRVRMFSYYVPEGQADLCESQVMDALSGLVRAAEGTDIVLCHENEKAIYGDIAVRCLKIHKNFPELRAVFDPANFIQCGQDTLEAWDMLSPYVDYMHVKDALADGSVVPAGKGIGNLSKLLQNYQGEVLTLEPHLTVFPGFEALEAGEKTKMPYTYPSSRAAFDAAANALKEVLKEI